LPVPPRSRRAGSTRVADFRGLADHEAGGVIEKMPRPIFAAGWMSHWNTAMSGFADTAQNRAALVPKPVHQPVRLNGMKTL